MVYCSEFCMQHHSGSRPRALHREFPRSSEINRRQVLPTVFTLLSGVEITILGKRKVVMEPIAQVSQALEVIENVCQISSMVWVNKQQCKRIADRFSVIAEGLKGMGLDKNSGGGKALDRGSSSSKDYPGFDELLKVLRKGEALVSYYTDIISAINLTDNREAFVKIHQELDTLDSQFRLDRAMLTEDAEKDLQEILPKNLEELARIDGDSDEDPSQALQEKPDLDLETLRQMFSRVFDRVVTKSEHTMGLDMEKAADVVVEKSNLISATDKYGGVEPSQSYSMVTLDEEDLITEVSQAVEEMTSKWNSTSVGGLLQRGESHPVSVPSYLRIHPSDIRKVRQIGDVGGSAEVYEAIWSFCPCAVKRFKSQYSREFLSVVQQELNYLIALRHPHVVRLMGLSVDSQQRCSIVMELMSSSLRALIKRRSIEKRENVNVASIFPFTPSEALDIITKIALGMWFLHTKGVSHRDLKSHNVLIQEFGGHITEVKLVDFGASLNIDSSGMQATIGIGTGFWRAPEILPSKTADRLSKPDLMAADVYSFAMTCYEVLTGGVPFEGQLQSNEYDKVIEGLRPRLPENLDDELEELVKLCWAPDPKRRPKFETICEQLLHIRSRKFAVGTDQSGKHGVVIRQVIGAFTGLPDRVCGNRENINIPAYESSSCEDLGDNSKLVDELNFFPGLNDLKFLSLINCNDLKKQRHIGSGSSAKVYEATWLGCAVAVKIFYSRLPVVIEELALEVEFLISLCHPHIVQLVGLSLGAKQYMIVMELMSTDLRNLIESRLRKRKLISRTQNTSLQLADVPPFDLLEAVTIIRKIALGMAFLHSRGVINRDLKSPNVLVQELPGHIDVKLVDFGWSRYLNQGVELYIGVGTRFWRAPEILPVITADRSSKPDLKAADVYSFAMVCYEVLTGGIPCAELRSVDYELVIGGYRPTLPSDLYPELRLLIEQCWHGEPVKRPKFMEICERLQRIEQTLSLCSTS